MTKFGTRTDSPGNGHGLTKLTPRAAGVFGRGQGVTNSKMWEICQTAVPIGTKFDTLMQIHQGMEIG